jgi:hypothetical protein
VLPSQDRPAVGRACAQLQTTGKATAWLLSAPLTGPGTGELAVVSFSVRRGAGQANLALDIVGTPEELGDAGIWEGLVPADGKWHRVSLLLRVPAVKGEATRLAFGVAGAAGSWQLDDIAVTKGSLPTSSATPLPGVPTETGRLPAGWEPNGNLDATATQIGAEDELSVNVNGLAVSARPTMVCYRGFREGLVLYAVNRGQMDKELQLSAETAPEVEAPSWTVPIKGNGTTRFHMAVQGLRQGKYWLKLNLASGPDKAALPVQVEVRPSYPALGALWNATAPAEAVAAVLTAPVDVQVLVGPPDYAALQPTVERLRALHTDILGAPLSSGLQTAPLTAALSQLSEQWEPNFWIPWPSAGDDLGPVAAAATAFAGVQQRKTRSVGVFSPPLPLRRVWPDGRPVPAQPEALNADRTAGLLAITVRPPRLGAPCVLGEQLDGKGETAGGAAFAQNRQADLGGLRAALTARQANLPLLVMDLAARSSGDPRLDALALARALTLSLAQGSTGAILAPQRSADNGFGLLPLAGVDGTATPTAQVVRELSAELASATPVVPLAATEGISPAPDAVINFRPFLRGGEGIVVLWNNSSVGRDVTLEFRSQPVSAQYLRFAYQGDFVQRRWHPIFQFSEEAFQRKRPVLMLRINPLEVYALSFRLLDPHTAWLRTVEFTKPFTPNRDAMPPGREERTWWRDMLGGRPNPNDKPAGKPQDKPNP